MKYIFLLLSFLFLSNVIIAQCSPNCESTDGTAACCSSHSCSSETAGGIAPIGVMGDHYHHKGGLMFSYRFMNMTMDGNIQGDQSINDASIFENYMMSPKNMSMQMHMLGLMYGIKDRVTLMVMANYLENEMNLTSMEGMAGGHASAGIGDIKFSLLVGLLEMKNQSLILKGGLSIPTGSIDESEMHLHSGMHEIMMNLPYPMQLGSGTWDVLWGATYLAQKNKFTLGVQPSGVIRIGKNENDYRFGNEYQLSSWGSYRVNNWLSTSFRATGIYIDDVIGKDKDMVFNMAPTSDFRNTGGWLVNANAGLSIRIPNGKCEGLILGLEYGLPVYQDWKGIQMKRTGTLTTGLKYSLF